MNQVMYFLSLMSFSLFTEQKKKTKTTFKQTGHMTWFIYDFLISFITYYTHFKCMDFASVFIKHRPLLSVDTDFME